MQLNQIKAYNIFTSPKVSGVSILLHDGTREDLKTTEPGRLMAWVDILRNEDPVFYNRKTEMMYTGEEPTGEGE